MTKGFGKFLRDFAKGRTECYNCKAIIEFTKGGHIAVEDLGEWAMEKIIEWRNDELHSYSSKDLGQKMFELRCIEMNSLIYQIAVGCLGKKEVNSRLLFEGGGKE